MNPSSNTSTATKDNPLIWRQPRKRPYTFPWGKILSDTKCDVLEHTLLFAATAMDHGMIW